MEWDGVGEVVSLFVWEIEELVDECMTLLSNAFLQDNFKDVCKLDLNFGGMYLVEEAFVLISYFESIIYSSLYDVNWNNLLPS